jgi:hypothetical protein
MAGTVRIVFGILLILAGLPLLFVFLFGLLPIALGALLIWSGQQASQQEQMQRQLQQQQAQFAYLQGAQVVPRLSLPYFVGPPAYALPPLPPAPSAGLPPPPAVAAP